MISSNLRDGSLREAAAEYGIPMLLYEAGEALRFDEVSIRAGVSSTGIGVIVVVFQCMKIQIHFTGLNKGLVFFPADSQFQVTGFGIRRTLAQAGLNAFKNKMAFALVLVIIRGSDRVAAITANFFAGDFPTGNCGLRLGL